ncbi:hypothetical protein Tsubulata_030106 [Turnera subulata]|uniref:Uncharacterized protein n=1 Tax=Turnera subulata TaxID=218843 RepID=A0A9Q0FQF8_9ROSI|nr:hypothetical protein Tsubulata_030106 [Turnera subulata]
MFSYSSLAFLSSFFFALTLSFSLCLFFLAKNFFQLNKRQQEQQPAVPDPSVITQHLSKLINGGGGANNTGGGGLDDPTHLTRSLLLDILPSDSPNWKTLFGNGPDGAGSGGVDGVRDGSAGGGDSLRVVKKKKKKGKKKRLSLKGEEENVGGGGGGGEKDNGERGERGGSGLEGDRVKPDLVCRYPFTSTSSATQRKIKQQYDQLVKCNESKGLTLTQVFHLTLPALEISDFLTSEVIKRKFTITKVLLLKADRSSVDRYRQQIYKLELEQKRLEEDAFVYNWLQEQLKLSPAYKQILEISDCAELKAKSGELLESKKDTEFSDISFEELLAQEKKDAFWQKHGKSRTCSS